MKKLIELKPPSMPNFILYENPVKGFDVGEFTEEEATEYSNWMKHEFMNHWRKRKSNLK